jgi:hypothetical protein
MFIPIVALMFAAPPAYSVEVERESEVEQDTEIDDGEIETERSVESDVEVEDEDFDGTTSYKSRREHVVGPGAVPGSTVHQKSEETVVDD